MNINLLHVTKTHVYNPVKSMGRGKAIVRASQCTNFYRPEPNKRERGEGKLNKMCRQHNIRNCAANARRPYTHIAAADPARKGSMFEWREQSA